MHIFSAVAKYFMYYNLLNPSFKRIVQQIENL